MTFRDRVDAGRQLAREVLKRMGPQAAGETRIVLGLPRGGVPVAAEVARVLDAPLDVLNVRKLGTPGHEELAMGAIATGGHRILDEAMVQRLGISEEEIEAVERRERETLEQREVRYRGSRPWPDVEGTTVIVVDDGVATGATMKVALKVVRAQHPAKIVVAVPLAPRDTLDALRTLADEVVCLNVPSPFYAVGQGYATFASVTDEEVVRILNGFRGMALGEARPSAHHG